MKRQRVIDFLLKRYHNIYKAKQNGTISWVAIKEEFNRETGFELQKDYFRNIFKTIKVDDSTLNSELSGDFQFLNGNENKDKGTKEFVFTANRIPTEEEIVEHFNIDLQNYRISQIWHKTTPGGKYSISVNLQAIRGDYAIDYKKQFQEFLQTYNINKLNLLTVQKQIDNFNRNTSVLLNLSDLHVGKLTWEKEVGADYNVDLAKKVFLEALKNLTYQTIRCFGVEEFVLNIGGDFLHTNGSSNQTANGTNMNDVDTRYQKIFSKGLEILTEGIDFLSSFEGVKVKLFIVQGNHDLATSYYLGESLKAFYRKEKNIEIVNDPHIRKYHKYGISSYMLTHGDCKDDGLPLTFATEKPDYFSTSEYRYIFLGHLHKTSRKVYLTENEVNGVVLRRLNSLSPSDAWHNSNNFVGAKRMANALVFDKNNGQIAEFNYIIKK